MGDILTQQEVDSLLSGLSEGKVEAETDVPTEPVEGVRPYDFIGQEKVIRGRMPTFEVINERFTREIRSSISNLLHTTIDIATESMETVKFSEFGRSLPVPTSLHVFRMEPLRGHVLLVLESQLVFNLIDTFFGGNGDGKAKVEGREFTAIEEVMIHKVVNACLKGLETAWAPVEKIEAVYVRSEVNPQFAAIVPPTDLVIVVKFEVELEQSTGIISLCLPYAMIEPIRNKLASGFQSDAMEVDHVWQRRVKEIILDSRVDLTVLLGSTEITGERLIHLKVGDVIQLDQSADETLVAMVEGVPKLKGYAGIQRGFQAFKVEEKIGMEVGQEHER
ncbi:MAG: flagellar motor switch protein FliM [Deltaproteobacteria bacterium]|nr:flagellar motor switch protein FliM [Deltaproteobacteria bacterium]MBW1960811.1 flagellar motor switch protein FliM [Deltaproteobacteria bacterium]MBW2151768.1 flagellar motor switch protein FliM [Deltaproteobacteria bacterium]